MSKVKPSAVVSMTIPCVSKYELMSLISHGWKVVRNSLGWFIVANDCPDGRKIVVACSTSIIEESLAEWPRLLKRHFSHLEYVE